MAGDVGFLVRRLFTGLMSPLDAIESIPDTTVSTYIVIADEVAGLLLRCLWIKQS